MSHYVFEKQALPGGGMIWGAVKDLARRGGKAVVEQGKKMVSPGTGAYEAARAAGKSTARAFGEGAAAQGAAAKQVAEALGKTIYNNPTAQAVGQRAADITSPVTSRVGRVGQFTTDVTRNALNLGDDAVARLRGQNRPAGAGWGLGDAMISPTAANPSSLRNVAVGAGTLYGGSRALGLTGGSPSNSTYVPQTPAAAAAGLPAPASGGGFLSGIPKEMQYAAMAGVPLALMGAYMGGGKGMGLGALGLGALGLGAAGSGYFGDDARRMVGQGANSLMGLFGGNQNGDMMQQIEMLGNLSPEFGVTMLMGKNPGLTREEAEQMYQFLTQNKGAIQKMLPQIMGAKTPTVKAGSLLYLKSAARCWSGYEPVPGKKPYSSGSCRPSGSKKKKQEKKSAFPFARPGDPDYREPAAPTMQRPTMTQMPPKPPMKAGPPRDFSKLPPYVSIGQQEAEQAAQARTGQQPALAAAVRAR